jgi:hypothetical protein
VAVSGPTDLTKPAMRLQVESANDTPQQTGSTSLKVEFSDHMAVPFPFRRRRLASRVARVPQPLQLHPGEQTLAQTRDGPVWTVSETSGGLSFRSAFAIADMDGTASFSQVFCADRFIENLPLIEFVRRTGGERTPQTPPLRATFMFDDPNLHRPTYGHIDFAAIAEHARRFNHHVAFATIPLDSWYAHRATAELFHRHRDRLSLLVHGNNHLKHEMARDQPDEQRVRMLNQALARITRLERTTALDVCRSMVPPHGACSAAMLAWLPQCGFDGACISAGSLIAHNPGQAWTRELGFLPAERVEGCPVLPRAALTGNAENAALINAYLGQPIILRGHHNDVKDGLERLEQLASLINGLGDVTWANLSQLSRMSYRFQMRGALCRVTPLAARIRFDMPNKARQWLIEPSNEHAADSDYKLQWGSQRSLASVGQTLDVGWPALGPIDVQRRLDRRAINPPPSAPLNLGSVIRRILTESRDRLALN